MNFVVTPKHLVPATNTGCGHRIRCTKILVLQIRPDFLSITQTLSLYEKYTIVQYALLVNRFNISTSWSPDKIGIKKTLLKFQYLGNFCSCR